MSVIKVEDVSKLYRLGQIGTGTLSHDLKRWWAAIRGLEDPYLKLGAENDRTKKSNSDYAWALKDISFEVQQGDTLGIIGKNGAGKSTLLKILSRVTSPTSGNLKIKGRIASLLEVGTGFNPEMTGKENIYMNGAILGMTKKEITKKFDEIVEFSGVALYVNTPVKRYSSGMYVRLAFAVAAHLEPEILIVDEVLAVGDADFQKKCLGKMNDVAYDGRTIIFVSHNMQAVQSLCKSVLYLKNGQVVELGKTNSVINNYLSREIRNRMQVAWVEEEAPGNDIVKIVKASILAPNGQFMDTIAINNEIWLSFEFVMLVSMITNISLHLLTPNGVLVFDLGTDEVELNIGKHNAILKIPANLLNSEIYTIRLLVVKDGTTVVFSIEDILTFEVNDLPRTGAWYGKWEGVIRPNLEFLIK